MQLGVLALIMCCWMLGWCLKYCSQRLMAVATSLTISPSSPQCSVSLLLSQILPHLMVTPCPGSPGTPVVGRIMLRPWMAWLWMPAFSLLGVGRSPRHATSCQPPLCRLPHLLAASTNLQQLPHQPGREGITGHSLTGNVGTSSGCTSIRVLGIQRWQGFSGASIPAWYDVNAGSIVSSKHMFCSEKSAAGPRIFGES